MAGRSQTEALHQLIDPIQQALNSFTVGHFTVIRNHTPSLGSMSDVIVLNGGEPALLRSQLLGSLQLRMSLWAQVQETLLAQRVFHARTVRYAMQLADRDGAELFGFHWNPFASSGERTYPHVHIGGPIAAKGSILPDRFHKLHIPTGIVTPEALFLFAIEELDVQVRPGRDRNAVIRALGPRLEMN